MQMLLLILKNGQIASIIPVRAGEVWKLFCELQNILPNALLFIMKDLN